MATQIMQAFADLEAETLKHTAKTIFGGLIQESQYVGEVFSIGYESALVQIHDFHRRGVGGIPGLSFLIATRVNPKDDIDYTAEDSSIILLRVMDAAPLPNEADALRVRVETAQRVSGDTGHWDDSGTMDPATHNLLSFAGLKCRIIGTFFLDSEREGDSPARLALRFGSDISNFYPNRGLKVYKPNGASLRTIVNYRDSERVGSLVENSVTVGSIRYASTNRTFQEVSNVPVELIPVDLLGQKTALFGMTRTGKSNTTKIILSCVFDLRLHSTDPKRIGQIVFDPNGEYANENVQDKGAVKNVWKSNSDGDPDDVVSYGITKHPADPNRKLMLLNFYDDVNLQIGKEIIDAILLEDRTKFATNFCQVVFSVPAEDDYSALTRYNRRVLVYRALLVKAGFTVPADIRPVLKGLFKQELLKAMETDGSRQPSYATAAAILGSQGPSWDQVGSALVVLYEYMKDKDSGYRSFDQKYVEGSSSGESWADADLEKLLEMLKQPNGPRQIGKARSQHTHETGGDYAEHIYEDLVRGRLVIVDQSSGEPEINKSSADRIMWHIFRRNQEEFRRGLNPHQILVYVEEAHNLLPEGSDKDLHDVWVRTAKEGAKYNIGMVYATQEVSSIQRNILKNTANWFIGHLNNTDETRELCKYYDFADFEASIRRAQDRGFVRVKTLSNMFVIPVQIKKFRI